jgi:two-component system nitrate/nitrite response regulator NarL
VDQSGGRVEDVDALQAVRRFSPNLPVLVLADKADMPGMTDAWEVGVQGVLHKGVSSEAFTRSVELMLLDEGIILLSRSMEFRTALPSPADPSLATPTPDFDTATEEPDPKIATVRLWPREDQILRCLIEGKSNKLIARELSITESTVKVHIQGVLRKVNAQNRTQAAIRANRLAPPR